MPTAAAFSACTMDEFPQKNICKPGGNSLNFVLHARRRGWDASIIGAIGNDQNGKNILSLLKSRCVNHTRLYTVQGHTAKNRITIKNGERYSKPEDWNGGVYEQYRLSKHDWKFIFNHDWIATTLFDPNFSGFLDRLHDDNLHVSVDFMHSPDPQSIQNIADKLTLIFLSCAADEIKTYLSISTKTPIIFMLSGEGSAAYYEGKLYKQDALPVKEVIDTTGCGDAFHAAFCCSWHENHDIPSALYAGAAAGKETLAHIGGTF